MTTPEHPAPRRFGPYPEDAAQEAIWRELDPDAFADDDADAAVAPAAREGKNNG